jgi:hypothetical protein
MPGDNLQSFNRLGISNNIVEEHRPVLFNPVREPREQLLEILFPTFDGSKDQTHQGSS